MDGSTKRKIAAGAVAGLALAGGGGAIAATKLGSPSAESKAVVSDAAKQLGVQPSALSDALKTALKNRVDAAVAAGSLTKEQADAIKKEIDAGTFPIFGGYGHFGHPGGFGHVGHFGHLDAAASFLGVTTAQLESDLSAGKTLAQIAKDRGKTVDGLVKALTDAEKKELDAAVAAGRLTQAQEQSMLAELNQRITDLVNGTAPPHLDRGHDLRPSADAPGWSG